MTKQDYVLGFCFDDEKRRVVLIRKNRPAWQAGKLNGVGGKIETFDSDAFDAMCREFIEETGVNTKPSDWRYYAKLHGEYFTMYVFCMFSTNVVNSVRTVEDEEVVVKHVSYKPIADEGISNLPWLITLALDSDQPRIFIEAKYAS